MDEKEKVNKEKEANIPNNRLGLDRQFERDFKEAYGRLVTMHREKNEIDDEIRVLETIVWILENIVFAGQEDRLEELERYKERLGEAKGLKNREKNKEAKP